MNADPRILESLGWLAKMPPEFRSDVLGGCELIECAAGRRIYEHGGEADGVYGVLEGRVGLSSIAPDGTMYLSYIGGRGFWLGLATFLKRPRRFMAESRSHCALLFLSASRIEEVCADKPLYWKHFFILTNHNLEVAIDVLDVFRHEAALGRVAAVLHMLAVHDPSEEGIQATQADIAEIARVSLRTVAAALADLQEKGIIRRQYRRMEILDMAALRKLAAA
ncbi:Crp/Fnr family transcriptional regulator [Halovulum sp. GXIMD14794]